MTETNARRISHSLSFKNRKSLGVKVYPDATVEISAPSSSDENEVIHKIREKAPWIMKQQDFLNSFKPSTPERKFVNGETHLYLGRQYKLNIIASDTANIMAYRWHLLSMLPIITQKILKGG